MEYEYYINQDERGEFSADVRDPDGKTIFEFSGFDMFEDGFMEHKHDMSGLTVYLRAQKCISQKDVVIKAN